MKNLNYWNVRKDGVLILKPDIRPAGIYVSFNPTKRQFLRHVVHPTSPVSEVYWTPIESSRVDPRAVAEATAYAITLGRH